MSNVRKALKIDDVWQPKPAVPSERRVLPIGPSRQESSLHVDAAVVTTTDDEWEDIMEPPESLPKASLSFTARLLRRVKRLLGIRNGVVVPRCNGLTRNGLSCRAPAMLNGYCRMHGGSRRLLG
jgi:hypothetical protein